MAVRCHSSLKEERGAASSHPVRNPERGRTCRIAKPRTRSLRNCSSRPRRRDVSSCAARHDIPRRQRTACPPGVEPRSCRSTASTIRRLVKLGRHARTASDVLPFTRGGGLLQPAATSGLLVERKAEGSERLPEAQGPLRGVLKRDLGSCTRPVLCRCCFRLIGLP